MIVSMSKFQLTALLEDRPRILAALQKTRVIELTLPEDSENESFVTAGQAEALGVQLARVRKCIDFLCAQADNAPSKDKEVRSQANGQIVISYQDFAQIALKEEELMNVVARSEERYAALTQKTAQRNKLLAQSAQLVPYLDVEEPFTAFADTRSSRCMFGLVDENDVSALEQALAEEPLAACTLYRGDKQRPVAIFCHADAAERVGEIVASVAFSRCALHYGVNAAQETARLEKEMSTLLDEEKKICALALSDVAYVKDLKIYADYLSTEQEKAEAAEKFFGTKATFTAQGYLPEEQCEHVRGVLSALTDAYVLEYSAPEKEDTPPTLLKNKGPAKAAEFVTNMYSVPDYREYDPNGFVFFFFMLFFGLIMADIGYGVLLFLGGLLVSRGRKANDGVKKLATIMVYGGIFTAIFGALFGSLFGFSLYTFLPDPSSGSRTNVLIILLGCLALGLLQITVGYVLKAINSIRRREYSDAICDSLTWIIFDIGLFFAVFNFLTGYFDIPVAENVASFFEVMTLPGVIMVLVGLLGAMLTAGRKEKFIGKFTKGFGAVYGIINLLSDVLSYARLFGLMLSGMIIAQQFNIIGLNLMAGGALGYVFGPIVMVIGHAFNLAMGVLGAYIHDCRLQYIEFFSKFYTGEGRLFTPLGSRVEYINFTE